MDVSNFVVVSGGVVDVDASVAKFSSELATFVADRQAERDQFAAAVSAVFADNVGKSITVPNVVALVVQRLNGQTDNFNKLSKRVAQFIREDAASPTGTLQIARGKGGGVSLRTAQATTDTAAE